MGKLWMPVSNFKKIHEDDKSATLRHPDGHEVKLAKSILSPHMAQQLAALPLHGQKMAKGGRARFDEGGMAGDMGLSCGADGTIHQGSQSTGQPIPQMGGGAPQQQGPSNVSIPQRQPTPAMDPSAQGMGGLFKGQSPQSLMNKGTQQQLGGARQAMVAQQNYAKQANPMLQQQHDEMGQDLNKFWNGYQRPDGTKMPGYNDTMGELGAVKTDVLTNQINPNRFIEQGALPKVMAAIGLLGTMANSRGGGPKIMEFLNQQMQRDVQAQMADKSGKISVLQANLQQLGNMRDAFKMTTLQHQAMQSALLEQAANNTNSDLAKAAYMQASGQIYQNMAKEAYQWHMNSVLSSKVGVGGQQGQQGMQGGAQKSGAPTDAVGNPLPQGLNINPSAFKEQGPVALPGGGYGFAGDQNSAEKAKGAISAHDQLDTALKRLMQVQAKGAAFPSIFGLHTQHRQEQADAMDGVHEAVRNVARSGERLTDEQKKALSNMANIPENPLIFRGGAKTKTRDLGNVNNDAMNSQMKSYIQNYEAPQNDSTNKEFNEG